MHKKHPVLYYLKGTQDMPNGTASSYIGYMSYDRYGNGGIPTRRHYVCDNRMDKFEGGYK